MTLHKKSDADMSRSSANQCIRPGALQEGDLLAYLDGDAPSQVAQHLDDCAVCRAELAELTDLSGFFGGALFRMACPPAEDLLGYQANLLGLGDRREIDLHLHTCAHCQAELAELAAVPSATAPAPAPGLGDRLRQAGRRLIDAVLITPATQPVLQLRGDERASLIYQAGDFQVILAKVPPVVAENIWQIEGQLMAESPEAQRLIDTLGSLTVRLLGPGDPASAPVLNEDVVDDLGFFSLEGVTSGTYTIEIAMPDADMHFQNFTIP